jgi:hypothetical protein
MSARNRHLSIRFTQPERDLISLVAETENRSAADWARLLILTECQKKVYDVMKEEAA